MKDYLPVGSVVSIKEGKKPLVIMGYKTKPQNNKIYKGNEEIESDRIFDYCGVLFPEGVIDTNVMAVFNKDDIEAVLFEGYKTEETNLLFDFIKKTYDK